VSIFSSNGTNQILILKHKTLIWSNNIFAPKKVPHLTWKFWTLTFL